MSFQPTGVEHKVAMVDKLGEDLEKFRLACANLSKRGPTAVYEIKRMEQEMLAFAKDPNLKDSPYGDAKPRPPDPTKYTPEELVMEEQNYRDLTKQWELGKKALKMKVPPEDMYAIQEYMQPFWDAIDSTPAIKAQFFKAFTKDIQEQKQGLFGMGKGSS